MKYAAPIVALILAGAGAAFLWVHFHSTSASAVTCADVRPLPRIVAFGDSLVAGYGAPDGQGFVNDLSQMAGVPIENSGVNGNTTADGLARVNDVLAQSPNVVIVLLGGNDALQKKSENETEANLDALLSKLSAHAKLVLLGVPGGILSDPYAPMYARLAEKYRAEYVPNVLAGLLGNSNLMSDEVHPNAEGYREVAAKVFPALERVCGS